MADRDPQPFTADPVGYGTDVREWTRAQAGLLRARKFEALDLDNIIEEIESLGNEQEHAVESHLVVLIEHLTKLAVSKDDRPRRGWRSSATNARYHIERRLCKNPSLRREMADLFQDAWLTGRRQAMDGLREAEEHLVPNDPPFSVTQALDPDFFPGTH